MNRRSRLGRLRRLVDAAVVTAAHPRTEVWLPVKDGSGVVPGRYPQPGGRTILVLYDADDPAALEAPG